MKILYPLEVFYPSQAGGTANTVYWIAKNLKRKGFEPIIIATDRGLPSGIETNKWLDSDSGRTIFVRTRFMRLPLIQTLVSVRNVLRADVVHVSSVYFPTSFISAFAAFLLRKKLIWSIHGEFDAYTYNDSGFRKRIVSSFVRKIIGSYATYHSTCDVETGYIKNVLGEGVKVIEITNYFDVPREYERRGSKYLLFIGRLNHKKAIENLIIALSLSTEFIKSDFVLKIAGDGKENYKAKLRDLVIDLHLSNKIFFLGEVTGDAKHQLLADSYFTIMPSHTENFGLVVIESLAQNTPVIASKGSPWQILEKEGLGFWVDNSPEKLAEVIDKVLRFSIDEYESYRKRGRKFVLREFDMQKNIDKWVDIYRSL